MGKEKSKKLLLLAETMNKRSIKDEEEETLEN